MNKTSIALLIVFAGLVLGTWAGPEWQVYFSPNGGATDVIVAELGKATNSVLVQAYSFTSAPIAKALVDAHKRGLKIAIILDKGQKTAKYSSADFISRAGITTLIDAKHAIAHNKVMVIDGLVLITGSFNFTKAAEEKNAENLLISPTSLRCGAALPATIGNPVTSSDHVLCLHNPKFHYPEEVYIGFTEDTLLPRGLSFKLVQFSGGRSCKTFQLDFFGDNKMGQNVWGKNEGALCQYEAVILYYKGCPHASRDGGCDPDPLSIIPHI